MRPRAKITFPSRCCAVRASSRLVPPAPPCTRRSISEHCAESRQPLGLVDKNYRRVRIAITTGRYREAQNRGRVAVCAAWPGLPAGSERRLGDGAGTSSVRRKWWISSVGAQSRHCLVVETRAVNSSYLAEWLDAHRFAGFEGTKHRRALGTGSNQQFGQRRRRHDNGALDSVNCCDQVKHSTLHVSEDRTVRCMKLVHSSIEQARQRRRIETYLHSSFPMPWRRPIGSSIRAQLVPAYNSRISPTSSATGRESSNSNCWIRNFSSRQPLSSS